MKRFQFRLEKLLELRAYHEREWQLKLAEVVGAYLKLARRIKENIREADKSFGKSFKDFGLGTVDMNFMHYREFYLNRLKAERINLEENLEKKSKEREEVQKKYLEVSRKRKVLDKLKERKQAEYYAKQKREELKEQDEISIGRNVRKRGF